MGRLSTRSRCDPRYGLGVALVLVASGCTNESGPVLRNGCPVLTEATAEPGDDIDGDTFDSYASSFFADYCTRCHSTELEGGDRNDAPEGKNWDDEVSVRENLAGIRLWVGELNAMPIGFPGPTCEERLRLARWIDAGAP